MHTSNRRQKREKIYEYWQLLFFQFENSLTLATIKSYMNNENTISLLPIH